MNIKKQNIPYNYIDIDVFSSAIQMWNNTHKYDELVPTVICKKIRKVHKVYNEMINDLLFNKFY